VNAYASAKNDGAQVHRFLIEQNEDCYGIA
jgi:hypothetical protein